MAKANDINLEVTLCNEDRKRLDLILGGLEVVVKGLYTLIGEIKEASSPFQMPEFVRDESQTEQKAEEPVPEPVEEKKEEPAPAAEVFTMAQVQKKVMELCKADPAKKAAIKAEMEKYGRSISEIPEASYPAFMAFLGGM